VKNIIADKLAHPDDGGNKVESSQYFLASNRYDRKTFLASHLFCVYHCCETAATLCVTVGMLLKLMSPTTLWKPTKLRVKDGPSELIRLECSNPNPMEGFQYTSSPCLHIAKILDKNLDLKSIFPYQDESGNEKESNRGMTTTRYVRGQSIGKAFNNTTTDMNRPRNREDDIQYANYNPSPILLWPDEEYELCLLLEIIEEDSSISGESNPNLVSSAHRSSNQVYFKSCSTCQRASFDVGSTCPEGGVFIEYYYSRVWSYQTNPNILNKFGSIISTESATNTRASFVNNVYFDEPVNLMNEIFTHLHTLTSDIDIPLYDERVSCCFDATVSYSSAAYLRSRYESSLAADSFRARELTEKLGITGFEFRYPVHYNLDMAVFEYRIYVQLESAFEAEQIKNFRYVYSLAGLICSVTGRGLCRSGSLAKS
jgi:hypothetical protein